MSDDDIIIFEVIMCPNSNDTRNNVTLGNIHMFPMAPYAVMYKKQY